MMDELMYEEFDEVDKEMKLLDIMDEFDVDLDIAEAIYMADYEYDDEDEEMEANVYNNCDLGELKELEGCYITKVEYNDTTEVAEITGIKSATGEPVEVSFQISGGICYVYTGKYCRK